MQRARESPARSWRRSRAARNAGRLGGAVSEHATFTVIYERTEDQWWVASCVRS